MTDGELIKVKIRPSKTIQDLINKILVKRKNCHDLDLYFKDKKLIPTLTISQSGLRNNDIVFSKNESYRVEESLNIEKVPQENFLFPNIYDDEDLHFEKKSKKYKKENKDYEEEALYLDKVDPIETKEINIKFLRFPGAKNIPNSNEELTSLLKLCLMKELSAKIESYKLEGLPDKIKLILKILKNGYTEQTNQVKEDIKNILEKVKGSNIINFSRFVDNTVNSGQMYNLIGLLNKNQKNEIIDINNRLARYSKDIKIFDKQFEEAMKESIMEFSVISVAIIEREDYETFEREKKKCPNRVDKLLYHGTGEEPVASIMTNVFRKAICIQHGRGVYFSDMLDYCWFYGGKKNNRDNMNKIPKKDETFTLIACSTYYDRKGRKHVYNAKYDPKKNEINFAYANAIFDTIKEADQTKFYGTEYVIGELEQICPFIGAKLKRVEFCCIWRDTNFSKEIFFDPKTDKYFKEYLKERMRYIEQYAEFNIYPCETSEEALKLIKRKKYNKIILLSNIGQDKGGKKFVDEARKIIGNDVIVLFSAYDTNHLQWVQNYKNALFSNEPYFFEEYLKCFSPNNSESQIRNNLINLKGKVENYYTNELKYKVKFNFDYEFIEYQLFKGSGKYSDLSFD